MLYNDVNATSAVINRCPWPFGVQIHGWYHGRLAFFVLFNWRAVLKTFLRLFRIKARESLEKTLPELFTKQKNGEKESKRALYNLRTPKLQEIFTTVAIVCHRYERLAVLLYVFAIILLWARKDIEKLFEESVYKQRRNIAFGTLKNA